MRDAAGLEKAFREGNLRALSRLITLAENRDPVVTPVLARLYPLAGKARVLGLTGAPGAGKSTLVGQYVRHLRAEGKRVAVIAIDPVSPFTGGSLLGDRIRLVEHFNDPGVFIRSLSTRGKLGGLSQATREAVHLADAFGFDTVIVETVGVGQNEVDIRELADLSVVLLVPEGGDGIQTLKAGVLEIGELFVVNKADREGADRMVREIRHMLERAGKPGDGVFATSQQDEAGYSRLFAAFEAYFTSQKAGIDAKRRSGVAATVQALLTDFAEREARAWVKGNVRDTDNPYSYLLDFLRNHPPGTLFSNR